MYSEKNVKTLKGFLLEVREATFIAEVVDWFAQPIYFLPFIYFH